MPDIALLQMLPADQEPLLFGMPGSSVGCGCETAFGMPPSTENLCGCTAVPC